MRVVAGSHRGRRLAAPKGGETRPTSDRVRESLFAVLGPDVVEGARVLDLFAGTGALGIEALSRGARSAAFVEASQAAIKVLQTNLTALDLDGVVVRGDARRALSNPRIAAEHYDLIFLDPPYRLAARIVPELAPALLARLTPDARVVCESDRRDPIDLDLPLLDSRRYGDTLISIHGT